MGAIKETFINNIPARSSLDNVPPDFAMLDAEFEHERNKDVPMS